MSHLHRLQLICTENNGFLRWFLAVIVIGVPGLPSKNDAIHSDERLWRSWFNETGVQHGHPRPLLYGWLPDDASGWCLAIPGWQFSGDLRDDGNPMIGRDRQPYRRRTSFAVRDPAVLSLGHPTDCFCPFLGPSPCSTRICRHSG